MSIRRSLYLPLCLPCIGLLLAASAPALQAQVPEAQGAADARAREGTEHQEGVWHVVQPGQTVYGISKANQLPIQALLDANPQLEGYTLRIGDSLWLPAAASALQEGLDEEATSIKAGTAANAVQQTPSPAGENKTGDLLEKVAADPDQPEARPAAERPEKANGTPVPAGRLHTLGEGETLFALAANLKVPLSELLALNPGLDHRNLKAGQQIRVPLDAQTKPATVLTNDRNADSVAAAPFAAPVAKPATELATQPASQAKTDPASDPNTDTAPGPAWHSVRQGETWYGIARQHGVALEALQAANPQHRAGLKPGIALRLPQGAGTADGPAASPKGAQAYAAPAPSIPLHWPRERGLATYLSDTSPASTETEALALHNGAPVGTRITVRNLMNNRSVEARVVGPLPNTAAQNRTVVTLSPQAAKALGAHDPRVLVEVAWPPQDAGMPSGNGTGQPQNGREGGR